MRKLLKWINDRLGRTDTRPVISLSDAATKDIHRKKLGRLGEAAAVKALTRKGYRIIDRNFLCRGGEIDIIAEHQGHIVFVEVKTRSPRAWNTPESAVTTEKQGRIIRAAGQYLAGFQSPAPARYDIVSVMANDDDRIVSVEIKSNAFDPATG